MEQRRRLQRNMGTLQNKGVSGNRGLLQGGLADHRDARRPYAEWRVPRDWPVLHRDREKMPDQVRQQERFQSHQKRQREVSPLQVHMTMFYKY